MRLPRFQTRGPTETRHIRYIVMPGGNFNLKGELT
jgi:hypothetical protein